MKTNSIKRTVLLLDDEKRQRDIISLILRGAGYDVTSTRSPVEALQFLELGGPFDLVLSDLRMPMMDGIEFLRRVKEIRPQQVVIVVTAHGSISTAVQAMKDGAFHYLTKPLDREEFLLLVQRAITQSELIRENRLLHDQIRQSFSLPNLIGQHGSMQQVARLIRKVAPTNTTVMIHGESGTGKELVARAIHLLSPRAGKPMQAINCAAIPEALLESELFGYEKGAFTGAYAQKKGLFELSSGTTLLLDEVGDLDPRLQSKILRVLQEREIQRIGGVESIRLDVRIISSTNRDLSGLVKKKLFREDLFYRLNTFPIVMPPLCERVTDIPLLVEHFIKKHNQPGGNTVRSISPAALKRLKAFPWPGNVRQLESTIERAIILADGLSIEEHDLPDEIIYWESGSGREGTIHLPKDGINLDELEQKLIEEAMARSGGIIAKAAPLLGLTYRTLQYRLQKLKGSR